jgi:hypothetical protein
MKTITKYSFILVLVVVLQLLSFATHAQAFITTWKTDNPGTSANNQITIPTTGGGYNYDIYWEDVSNAAVNGNISAQTGNATITFPAIGTYRVEIIGNFPQIYFTGGGDRLKILTVTQWGNIAWASMESAFLSCPNLTVPATDAPNLSGVNKYVLHVWLCIFFQPEYRKLGRK